jgi:hypothetical protein
MWSIKASLEWEMVSRILKEANYELTRTEFSELIASQLFPKIGQTIRLIMETSGVVIKYVGVSPLGIAPANKATTPPLIIGLSCEDLTVAQSAKLKNLSDTLHTIIFEALKDMGLSNLKVRVRFAIEITDYTDVDVIKDAITA